MLQKPINLFFVDIDSWWTWNKWFFEILF